MNNQRFPLDPNDRGILEEEIRLLKKDRGALIVAHNYQNPEVQEIADYVGDSLELSRIAANSDSEVILFCGVRFMAESAAILSPKKTILLPTEAGCPMAEMADASTVREWREKYPRAAVVCYVNSSAKVKAESDICCTSANAVNVIRSLEAEEIIFLPDQNLGDFLAKQIPEKAFHLWPGFCPSHHHLKQRDVKRARELDPEAELLVHPEAPPEVVAMADFVGSTSQIISRVGESSAPSFIIGTEKGILHGLTKKYPDKKLSLLSQDLVCPDMKRITLPLIQSSLKKMRPVITVPEPIRSQAYTALERMFQIKA